MYARTLLVGEMNGVKTSGLPVDSTRLADCYFGREAGTFQHRVQFSCDRPPDSPFRSAHWCIYTYNLESWVRILLILQEEAPYFLFFWGGAI